MKYWLMLTLVLLCSCGGEFWLTPNGHRAFYRSKDGQVSCYTDNCCWPYKERLMVCTQPGYNNVSVYVKYVPDK
jgi:hypothetical protein